MINWEGELRSLLYNIRKKNPLDVVFGGNFICPMILGECDMPVIRKFNRGKKTFGSLSLIDDLRWKEIATHCVSKNSCYLTFIANACNFNSFFILPLPLSRNLPAHTVFQYDPS